MHTQKQNSRTATNEKQHRTQTKLTNTKKLGTINIKKNTQEYKQSKLNNQTTKNTKKREREQQQHE